MLTTVLLLAALTMPASSQDDDFVRCTKCKNVGARPCGEHEKKEAELEHNVLFCSAVGLCPTCGGTAWVDCPHCESPAVEERLRKKAEAAPAVAAGIAYFEEELGRELLHAESPHFVVVFDIEALKVGKKKVEGHELLHRYVDHLELLFTDYTQTLGVKDSEFVNKSRILLWMNSYDHDEAARRYCGASAPAGVKLMGVTPSFSVPYLKSLFSKEDQFRRYVLHNTSHLLLSHQQPWHWMGETKGGWADAGLAHWFEHRYFERCDVYCYTEADTRRGFKGGNWKPRVRKMVSTDAAPSLAGLFQKNTDGLTLDEHAVAFSLVDYLITLDSEKLNAVLIELRRKTPTREALKKVYDLNTIQLEDRWKAWVLDSYPSR